MHVRLDISRTSRELDLNRRYFHELMSSPRIRREDR